MNSFGRLAYPRSFSEDQNKINLSEFEQKQRFEEQKNEEPRQRKFDGNPILKKTLYESPSIPLSKEFVNTKVDLKQNEMINNEQEISKPISNPEVTGSTRTSIDPSITTLQKQLQQQFQSNLFQFQQLTNQIKSLDLNVRERLDNLKKDIETIQTNEEKKTFQAKDNFSSLKEKHSVFKIQSQNVYFSERLKKDSLISSSRFQIDTENNSVLNDSVQRHFVQSKVSNTSINLDKISTEKEYSICILGCSHFKDIEYLTKVFDDHVSKIKCTCITIDDSFSLHYDVILLAAKKNIIIKMNISSDENITREKMIRESDIAILFWDGMCSTIKECWKLVNDRSIPGYLYSL